MTDNPDPQAEVRQDTAVAAENLTEETVVPVEPEAPAPPPEQAAPPETSADALSSVAAQLESLTVSLTAAVEALVSQTSDQAADESPASLPWTHRGGQSHA